MVANASTDSVTSTVVATAPPAVAAVAPSTSQEVAAAAASSTDEPPKSASPPPRSPTDTAAVAKASSPTPHQPQRPPESVLKKAAADALNGGLPAIFAMWIQVVTLMWLRTTVNYQYRYGTSMRTAFTALYRAGGVKRFYAGISAAMIQAPMSRFGDTAANAFSLSIFESNPSWDAALPTPVKTAVGSLCAAGFRTLLMPVDAVKSSLQVDGSAKGMEVLREKIRTQGVTVLWRGSLASIGATFVGHFPWFATYNYLEATLPKPDPSDTKRKLLRSAGIGFCCSAISDTCANSIRVIKTVRQTSAEQLTYQQVIEKVIREDGIMGLMGRGLSTKIMANGLQGLMFSVFWRLGQDWYSANVRNR